jgi:tripartite-type tricarboxylate transporter receptor subunit TctC
MIRFAASAVLMMATIAMTLSSRQVSAQALTQASNFPTRPVHVIVPWPPGGVIDTAARIIGQKLGEELGQQIVIENRPGASGTLGAGAVAKSESDGYTLLLTSGDLVTMPSLLPPTTFDANKDLAPIAMVGSAPPMLIAGVSAPFNNMKELVAAAKAKPGSISYGTPGIGTINHIAAEWAFNAADIKLTMVSYRGTAQMVNGVAAGDVPLGIATPSSTISLIEAKKIKPIALTSKRRPSFLPASWPTVAESGYDVDALLWIGVFAPVGTPAPIIERVASGLAVATKDKGVREHLNTTGIEAETMGQPEFGEYIKTDTARYADILKRTGIKISR